MDALQLKQLAQTSRHMRETGVALLLSSFLLGVFLFIPLAPQTKPAAQAVAAPAATPTPDAFAHAPAQIEAKAAIVYDLVTGETLYAHNADAQLPLASLTKLLTVYAALSELSPDTPVTVPADALTV